MNKRTYLYFQKTKIKIIIANGIVSNRYITIRYHLYISLSSFFLWLERHSGSKYAAYILMKTILSACWLLMTNSFRPTTGELSVLLQKLDNRCPINSSTIATGVLTPLIIWFAIWPSLMHPGTCMVFLILPFNHCLNWFILYDVIYGKYSKWNSPFILKMGLECSMGSYPLWAWNLNNLIKIF